jgi:hypothetical protein
MTGIDMYAEVLAGKTGHPFDDIRNHLAEIGWLGRYVSPLSIDLEDDPSIPAVVAASHVTEYEDEAGAGQGFELEVVEVGESELVDAPEIADESKLTQTILDGGSDGRTSIALNYSFRSGNLIGSVVIFFFEGSGIDPLEPEEMASTAEKLLQRMNIVLEDEMPDLFRMVLRPEPDPAVAWNNQYEYTPVVDGEFIGRYNIDPALEEEYQVFVDANGVLAEYSYDAYFEVLDRDDEAIIDGGYFTTITLFGSASDASAYGQANVDNLMDNPDEDAPMVLLDDELEGHDGVVGYSYVIASDLGNDVSGYSLYASIRDVGLNITLDGLEGVELEDALMLLEFQVDCVTAGPDVACEPIPIAELVE